MSSENKTTALIIGGSEGIGKATARWAILVIYECPLWVVSGHSKFLKMRCDKFYWY